MTFNTKQSHYFQCCSMWYSVFVYCFCLTSVFLFVERLWFIDLKKKMHIIHVFFPCYKKYYLISSIKVLNYRILISVFMRSKDYWISPSRSDKCVIIKSFYEQAIQILQRLWVIGFTSQCNIIVCWLQ